ncbi:UNVERIFIED_CONTAM: alpha-L-fucosidase [Murimonas intestini]|mgnify:CR=1 FL=1|uniref:alpha-L-fucosidase n=1 Tax=Murimonas intestini TaxID=1337051 RepID=A0AB73SXI6_9FIRM|nr:alpha-L-fucosidase [Murimonas intestini]MCR1843411.1 alpha-L-fucosidase [Murimonas intestini]MCR1868735.1 alpha-L-fucosidase [Murimonas intestini]MCR1886268.1 alpha-L-fucosidase [Murimonas intestini]
MNEVVKARTERTKWYSEARFGMFIHWGLYAIPSRGEWVRSTERIPKEEYDVFFDEFTTENYNPKEWARLAKKAGMKYAVLTAKHHDGFCLFDTKYTDFKSTNAPCKRDLVAEFLEAFRAEGIKVGLYFSLIDWRHPDYPHFGDMHHPMRENEEYKNDGRDFDRYLEFMHGQVHELLTNYGHLDLMWFDFSYGPMKCDTWKADKLIEMVRKIQPHIIIDNRLEGSAEDAGSIRTLDPTPYSGDFASPEQMIPPACICDAGGNPIPWEACITLNNNWGYAAHDHHYKSAKLVIRTLVECVSKGGNLILNVGPNAKGEIPKESVEILTEVGEWMKENGKSIYGCGFSDYPKPEWGRFTQNGNKLYAHVLEEQVGAICLPKMAGKVKSMRLVSDGSEIKESFFWNLKEYTDNAFFFFDSKSSDCYPLPDDRDTVVEITLKEE